MNVKVFDARSKRLRAQLNFITPARLVLIFEIYQREPVTYEVNWNEDGHAQDQILQQDPRR